MIRYEFSKLLIEMDDYYLLKYFELMTQTLNITTTISTIKCLLSPPKTFSFWLFNDFINFTENV